ncbi:hypothetical protein K2173_013506 [Erythroxylum novogranatense]|uniref:Major facilitator superfamily (MFS) profile domain-containing protein n=1 Tax=Erythroxylum novogranatense TaxID=1862640 RepID=A0AAV8TLT6_9ROSI|nr:hypothetical protein K2173_013506 [Erythroxylum novogranatense]
MAGPDVDTSGSPTHPCATKTLPDFDPPKKPKKNKYAIACAVLASLTSILLGYDIGVMSGASLFIKDQLKITDVQLEILVGTINIYSLVGSAVAGPTSDWIGRRYTVVVSGVIFFVGAILTGFAPNYAFLMVGRFVAGIGVGYALMIAPVYTAEISPASMRGFLTSFPEIYSNTGILLGYVSNFAFSKLPPHLGWRFMLGVAAIPSVVLAVGVLAMPESPRWLVMQGRLADAKRVLDKISDSGEEAQLRLMDIKEAAGIPEDCNDDIVEVHKKRHAKGVFRELFRRPTPAIRHIMFCGVGIHFFQQASGIDAVVLYTPRIFEKAGITSSNEKLLATVGVGLVKTSFIFVATFLLDKFGRRPLILTSMGGMILSLLAISVGLLAIDHSTKKLNWAIGLCFFSLLSFVGSFSIGMGPIAWVYSSEVFPLRLRAVGASMGVATNRLVSGIISTTFLSLYKAMTISGAFFMFAGIATVSFVILYACFPETRGRTLEDVEVLFGHFIKWRSHAKETKRKNVGNAGENDDGQVQLATKN